MFPHIDPCKAYRKPNGWSEWTDKGSDDVTNHHGIRSGSARHANLRCNRFDNWK